MSVLEGIEKSGCFCFRYHGVEHVCDRCLRLHYSEWSPLGPWVPLGECRVCLLEEVEKLESELGRARSRLRTSSLPLDIHGRPIPPLLLTAQGFESIRPKTVESKP